MNKVAQTLRELRVERHMTQREFASLLGVSEKTISNYEIAKRSPSIEFLIRVSKTFNVTLDYLTRGIK